MRDGMNALPEAEEEIEAIMFLYAILPSATCTEPRRIVQTEVAI
jgi:hypothetical protein